MEAVILRRQRAEPYRDLVLVGKGPVDHNEDMSRRAWSVGNREPDLSA